MASSTPPTIAGYSFIGELGRGGFSDVYLYQQHMPRRQVAIKVLRIDTLDARQRQAFEDEADLMAQLGDHPYIVSVLSAALTADGRPYLVMSYYPNDDLGQRVRKQSLPLAEALRTGIQLASAIETAHRVGVIHRDVKPANVLTDRSGSPGLTDFGIARSVQGVDEEEEIGVSVPWAAPEVLSGDSNGSVSSDIYSLAATIWHCLVGHAPFHLRDGDNSQSAMIGRILHSRVPETGVADVPPALERLLSLGMAKDPSHRPSSAAQLGRELQEVERRASLSRTDLVLLDLGTSSSPEVTPPPLLREPVEPTVGKTPTLIDTGGSTTVPDLVAPPTIAHDDRPRRLDQAGGGAPTARKPPTAVPDSEPAEQDGPAGGRHRSALVAVAVIGVAGAIGAAVLHFASGGGAAEPPTTGRTLEPTPNVDLVPTPALVAPVVTAAAAGDRAVFRWERVPHAGHYEWSGADAAYGTGEATQRTKIIVPFGGRSQLCVVVTAVGETGSSDPSDPACAERR